MNPYRGLGEKSFWSSAVAKRSMFDIGDLWDPKSRIGKRDKVVTFGSCFAQHIGRALSARGYNWHSTEPAPEGLSPDNAGKYNYGVFSCRTGNIYTVSLLKQWVRWAKQEVEIPDEVWTKGGRFFDPYRPNIEPDGFATAAEMLASRRRTVEAFRECLSTAQVFVFTLGLTESWVHAQAGREYPMCPGTVAGEFDERQYNFVNQKYPYIFSTLVETIQEIRTLNSDLRFVLTVSPVPLTATMSGHHVLVATIESKSILRAVAGHVAGLFDFVDYFPSYEIINGMPYRGTFFESNLRNVNHAGVDHVMNNFFLCLNAKFPPASVANRFDHTAESDDQKARRLRRKERKRSAKQDGAQSVTGRGKAEGVVCEEELLGAFGR